MQGLESTADQSAFIGKVAYHSLARSKMKKSGVPMVLVLLVAVLGLFAARSMARAVDIEEGPPTCCDMCKDCSMVACVCADPHLTQETRLVPISACRRKCSTNILVTGQILGPDERLAYGDFILQLQSCNLVLFNYFTGKVLFSSNTTVPVEAYCTLSFDDYGRLLIKSTFKGETFTIFTIPEEKSERGRYIAVLAAGGEVAIYGPRAWSAPPQVEKVMNIYESTEPSLGNVIFSGQALQNGQELQSHNGRTRFALKDGNLVLSSGGGEKWESKNSVCSGWNTTFAKLNTQGQLFILDAITRPVCWVSSPPKVTGEYVLAAQDDGSAAIYGPKVKTIPELESSFEGIRMVTAEQ